MGFIYLITSPSGKKYIGQTIQTIEKRWKQHIDSSKKIYKDHCKVLNKSLRKYDINLFTIEVLEECVNSELDTKEIEYIEKFNTIVPNGMNIKKGGSKGTHHEDTKKQISETLKGRKVTLETRQKMSKSSKEDDLPMYLIKISNGYRVCNHPMGLDKRFITTKKCDEYNYSRAIEYLNYLNNLTTPIVSSQSSNEKYIQNHKHGYCVKYPNCKPKYFVSKSLTSEILYKSALSYLNKLKSMSAVQRLNDSGEPSAS